MEDALRELEWIERVDGLVRESLPMEGGLGAIGWATLQMFREGGMPDEHVELVRAQMLEFFAKPDNDTCNAIVAAVEERLFKDKNSETELWY